MLVTAEAVVAKVFPDAVVNAVVVELVVVTTLVDSAGGAFVVVGLVARLVTTDNVASAANVVEVLAVDTAKVMAPVLLVLLVIAVVSDGAFAVVDVDVIKLDGFDDDTSDRVVEVVFKSFDV